MRTVFGIRVGVFTLLTMLLSGNFSFLSSSAGGSAALAGTAPAATVMTGNDVGITVRDSSAVQLMGVVERLQKRYDKTIDMVASFEQLTKGAGDSTGTRAWGHVWFKRPELMRWEYLGPEKKLIVTGDQDVYLYEQDVNQVTVIPRSQFLNSEITTAFFCGKGRLQDYFKISWGRSPAGRQEQEPWVLKLLPRKATENLKELYIFVDPHSYLVKAVRLLDQLGGETEIRFSGIRINTSADDALFRFVIPMDAEVFRLD